MSRQLVVFSPMPPSWSGIAAYTEQLLPALAEHWSITVVVGDDERVAPGAAGAVRVVHRASWRWFTEVGPVDRILWCIGNSMFHRHMPALIAVHGGVVLAHDVQATSLLTYAAIDRRDAGVLLDAYAGVAGGAAARALDSSAAAEVLPAERLHAVRREVEAAGALLFSAAIAGADAVAVHSATAASLATRELGGSIPIHQVPFGHQRPPASRVDRPVTTIATFGLVAPERGDELVLRAIAALPKSLDGIRLRFVGRIDAARQAYLEELSTALGVRAEVTFTGFVDEAAYRREMSDADIAVQLRTRDHGESSAAVADCLAFSLPTVVSSIGSMGELPADVVVQIPAATDPAQIARRIEELIRDAQRRKDLGLRARGYAADQSFERCAAALTDILEAAPGVRGL